MTHQHGKSASADSRFTGLRADALEIFLAGVTAADPDAAVRKSLRLGLGGGAVIWRDEVLFPGVLRIVALGKAACVMARAAAETLSPTAFAGPGIAVVNDDNAFEVPRFRIFRAGHPIPDERGEQAAREIEHYLAGARRDDGLLLLLSGGGSALLPAPADGITLPEKAEITRLLLASGADIGELNCVRKHLSRLKGGGLARAAFPAAIEALILSDVIGDDLSTIASGPTTADPTTFGEARSILERRAVWKHTPLSIRTRIERGERGEIPETPKAADAVLGRARNRIIASNGQSLDAAAGRARELGYEVHIASRALVGEARDAAAELLRCWSEIPRPGRGKRALLAGGETTVTVRGQGRGGRNQELALALAIAVEARAQPTLQSPWTFLSAGTDGRDGPTDAAGALVDPTTLQRALQQGLIPHHSLDDNDSFTFLDASGDLLRTGATGTNVADLQILLTE